MRLEDFLRKYKFPILEHLLRDREFNLYLYYESNELSLTDLWSNETVGIKSNSPRRITKEELEDYIKSRDSRHHEPYLSEKYIITENDIEFLKNSFNDFLDISRAKGILWSDTLIEKYREDWNWTHLSRNKSINWTKGRILKFQDSIDFDSLSYNLNIEIDSEILKKFGKFWNWNALSGNPTIAENIEHQLLEHPESVWTSIPDYRYGGISYTPLHQLNDIYKSRYSGSFGIKPSICSNPYISWDLNKFHKYEAKIDIWLLALFGKLDYNLIYEIGDRLNENRVYETRFTKYSDWHDDHLVYRNGWENLLLNENLSIDIDLLKFIAKQDVTIIGHTGNASVGHTAFESSLKANQLIKADRLDIKFTELQTNEELVPKELLSETKIHNYIYFNIIKPEFERDKNLIKKLIKYF